jgi:hypothetical protein
METIQGRVEIVGTVHGAMNCLVTPFACPDEWFYKQFVSQEQLDEYLRKEQYQLVQKEP